MKTWIRYCPSSGTAGGVEVVVEGGVIDRHSNALRIIPKPDDMCFVRFVSIPEALEEFPKAEVEPTLLLRYNVRPHHAYACIRRRVPSDVTLAIIALYSIDRNLTADYFEQWLLSNR